jgi:hypothetical protein
VKQPVLDARSENDLLALFTRRAAQYVPEWRFAVGTDEPGAAIASLFLAMFKGTAERLNMLPHKYYVEFLRLLGVGEAAPEPASGYVQFETDGGGAAVDVPEGTEIFGKDPDGGSVVFTTERKLAVTGARLTDLYYADAEGGRLERLPDGGERVFFDSGGGENLLRRRFEISQNDVLALNGACEIELELHQRIRFYDEAAARRLADAGRARWSYPARGEWIPFDEVTASGNMLTLVKNSEGGFDADENGRVCLRCELLGAAGEEFTLSAVLAGSRLKNRAAADSVSNSLAPIDSEWGGYCFGRRPGAYDMLYIRSDDIFRKRGALAAVQLDISIAIEEDYDNTPRYEFNKRVISKMSAPPALPDDVYVDEVVWEYYNGIGWAPLRTEGGAANPFSGQERAPREVRFTVPQDISSTFVDSEEGWFIRARVVNVRNYLSVTPRRLLPFLKGVECTYQYAKRVPIDYIRVESGAETRELENAAAYSDLAMNMADPLPPDSPRTVYLAFDAPPEAMPLAMRFSLAGDAVLGSKIVYEAFSGDGFKPLRVVDGTRNLRRSGCVFMYIPGPLTMTRIFGRDAYWLRMSLTGKLMPPRWNAPRVLGIDLNTVRAVQKQFAPERIFSASERGEARALELPDRPILDCEVFVNEAPPKDGAAARWTPWNRTETLAAADGEARVYELDRDAGMIFFGDGTRGMSPPSGALNIRVKYSHGGGARGNMDVGRVNALVGSIPRITGVANITPMNGGTDKMPAGRTEELGRRRFRHRGVALGASDFEEMTLERFPRVVHARCFRNTDGRGRTAPGHVCLAIMGVGEMIEDAAAALCADVYEFLSPRCDANLAAGGRLHVVHSTEVTLNVEVSVAPENPDLAAETQQAVSECISRLVNETWRARGIGDQADLNELHFAVRSAPNVASVMRLMPEGKCRSDGRLRTISLDGGELPPFMTVRNGLHTVRIG